MPELGRKYTCYSCHTKFYDLGKPDPICPKCGADQRDAEDAPSTPAPRARRVLVVVEEPAEETDFTAESDTPAVSEDEDEEILPVDDPVEDVAEEEEEEEY